MMSRSQRCCFDESVARYLAFAARVFATGAFVVVASSKAESVADDKEDLWERFFRETFTFYTTGQHRKWRLELDRFRDQGGLGPDEKAEPRAIQNQADVWTGWLKHCTETICPCDAPALGSAREQALGRLEEPCDCNPLPRSAGQLGRTLRLGRTLWCAVAASRVNVAADLFSSTGGSAILLAHGLASAPGRARPAVLWAWELQTDHALACMKNLKRIKAHVNMVKPPMWHGARAQAAIASAAVAGGGPANASVRAVVVTGAPPFSMEAGEQGDELIRALCDDHRHGTEFLFIDALGAFVPEFTILAQSCKRLQWVAVNNINLDEMAGWIARYLANVTGWHVVASGAYQWRSDVTLARGKVPRTRHWQLAARSDALLRSPPQLESWLESVNASSYPLLRGRTFAVPELGSTIDVDMDKPEPFA